MTPLAMLAGMLSGTSFKVVTFIILMVIVILVVLEFQKNRAELKVSRQQSQINDRILAGTL